MPKRSGVSQLPDAIRADLDARLLSNGFANYEALADWLDASGFQISKSALHRYGQKFEERANALMLATQQARTLVEASPDDAGAMNEALIRLVQEKLFTVLIDMEVDPSKINLNSLTKGIASLGRASVNQKEFEQEVRKRAASVADDIVTSAREAGMSASSAEEWRKKILGIGK